MACQMQRRPGVRRSVDEAMPRNVVARVEAVEIHAHVLELVGAVVGERDHSLITLPPRPFLLQHFREFPI